MEMESAGQASETYRVILTRRRSSEILFLPDTSSWDLPSVDVFPHRRLAEQLTREVGRILGVPAYCLLLSPVARNGASGEAKYTIMEAVRQNDHAPRGGFWVPRASLSHWIELAQARVVEDLLAQLDTYATGGKLGPFARPSWFRELITWAQRQLGPLGLTLTGGFRQLNASPTFSLIRLETDSGAVWFKATGKPNGRELSVTITLARLFPGSVPTLLGIHEAWNGWLSEEATGISLGETSGLVAWERAASELAELQIKSIGNTAQLLGSELKDLRAPRLTERIDPFLAHMRDLMAAQEKPAPAPLDESQLALLAETLRESCVESERSGFPDTLGHVDLNPGNILVSGRRCTFLDWAEGCVAHPVLTFQYLREHMRRVGIFEPTCDERLIAAYLRPWNTLYQPDRLRESLMLAPLLAVFAFAVSNDSWRAVETADNPPLAAYLRSLTRRMHREAIRLAERRESCPR